MTLGEALDAGRVQLEELKSHHRKRDDSAGRPLPLTQYVAREVDGERLYWQVGKTLYASRTGTPIDFRKREQNMAIQNFRWGPCPYCGASGWETAATRGTRIRDHDRPQGGRCLQPRKRNSSNEKSCGFAIGTYDERMIEEDARAFVEEHELPREFEKFLNANGTITPAGWEQINKDVSKIERNAVAWLRKTFVSARDDGHTGNELVGSVWYDPSNKDQMELLELASPSPGRGERIDFQDRSFGNFSSSMDGVSRFGQTVIGGCIVFFDVDEEF